MPRKWIRDHDWQRQPHAKGSVESLWWYDRPDRNVVVGAYLDQCRRGRALPENFKENLLQWLGDLSRLQNKKAWGQPRTYRYWTIPSYALAHGMKRAALMKRLRELEKIARQKFPDSVPAHRKARAPLTEKEVQEIKQQFLAGVDAKELARKFRVPPSQVGHLCREEKKAREAQREAAFAQPETLETEVPAETAPVIDDDSGWW